MAKVLINCTHGKDDPERAILLFIVGNVSATADQETKGVSDHRRRVAATKGYAEGVQQEGFPPLAEVLQSFLSNGGEIWACSACTNPRGISDRRYSRGRKDHHGHQRRRVHDIGCLYADYLAHSIMLWASGGADSTRRAVS